MSVCSSVNASFYGSSNIDRLETAKKYKKFRLKFRSMESILISIAAVRSITFLLLFFFLFSFFFFFLLSSCSVKRDMLREWKKVGEANGRSPCEDYLLLE